MRHLITTLLLCCAFIAADARTTVSLKGRLTTTSGGGFPNQIIMLTDDHGHLRTAKTDYLGNYAFSDLPAGTYRADFSAQNYESQSFTGITINPKGPALLLNVQLRNAGAWGNSTVSRRYVAQKAEPARSRPVAYHYKPGAKGAREVSGMAMSKAEGAPIHAYKEYAAPLIEPESPGGRAVKSADVYEKASAEAPKSIALTASSSTVVATAPAAHAGMLTSGEINDFSKWTLWEDVNMDALKSFRSAWPFRPEARYTVLVKSKNGMPLCNARVKMSDGSGQVWEALTDNTGKAELWYGMWSTKEEATPRLSASVDYDKEHFNIASLKPFAEGANILSTRLSCLNPSKLDIAFIVDATGSMGDEISYLKEELRDILQKVHDSMPAMQVQTGALFYRDLEDEYLTRISDLTADFSKTEAFMADNGADGGGDTPEGVDAALEEAFHSFHWRSDATTRLAFLVLDAPPHGDAATVKRVQELTQQFAAQGIRIIPVVCSGSDKPTEYLMRSIALATNGTYLFLTDHSGIGLSHTAPTTDRYDVEYLNGLIYRVIYQLSYMPACDAHQTTPADTAQVQQRTDSATISWRYWPNPTTGVLHIEHTNTSGYLFVTDITGKLIMRVPADVSGVTTIDLTQYPAGVYAIRYNWADDKWVSGKFVLMR